MEQRIGQCITPDDVRIAYAVSGDGPALVKAANWLNHLEFDWESPVFRHYFAELSARHRLVRYDERGNGLSERDVDDFSFEAFVRDLEAVVDELELEDFTLFGVSQGCAVSIEYAVRHPERVRELVLLGGYARGWAARATPREVQLREAMLTLTAQGWGTDNPAFREMFASIYVPDGNPEHIEWWSELQRVTTTPENAVAILRSTSTIDIRDHLALVQAPTLVLHARGDRAVPFSEGETLASGIPGARLVALESRNHIILEHEPAWPVVRDQIRAFLSRNERERDPTEASLLDLGAPSGLGPVDVSEDLLATGGGLALFGSMISGDDSESIDLYNHTGPTDPPEDDGLLGETVGHYRIEEPLGIGGMGVVYRAVDQRLERPVALKFLPAHLVKDPRALERFVREARAVSGLVHPNICVLHEIGRHQGRPYLVLELLQGATLESTLREGPLPVERALEIGRGVAEGLAVAHEAGILHRDIKPANLFLTRHGHVKVLDFGIAKLLPPNAEPLEGPEAATRALHTSLTQPGMTPGTFAYMSPEQLRGEELDPRSDLFSLGAVVLEMVTGRRAFPAPSPGAIVESILRHDPLEREREEIGPELKELLSMALSKDREKRFPSAQEMGRALDRYRLALLSGAHESRAHPEARTSRRPTWRQALASLLGVALTLALLAWLRDWRDTDAGGAGAAPVRTVAVLPAEDLSPIAVDSYLALSIPDEVISVLARSPDLAVRSLSETRHLDPSEVDPAQILEDLGADHLITAQLYANEGQLRVTLEAVETEQGRIVWRDTISMTGTDPLRLREKLSELLSEGLLPSLKITVTDGGTAPGSSEAYRLYLDALQELNDPDPNRDAIQKLERSVELDPSFAPAWAQLGRRRYVSGYYWQGSELELARAREELERALELSPGLIDATDNLISLRAESGEVEEAYLAAREVAEQRPRSSFAQSMIALTLRYAGLIDEAVAACERGLELDPLDSRLRSCTWAYMLAGDFERAGEFASRTQSLLWENDINARIALTQGRPGEALRLWSRQTHSSAGRLRRDTMVACLKGESSPENELRLREELEDLRGIHDPEWKFLSAGLFAYCGQTEFAVELLTQATNGGYCVDPSSASDPLLAPVDDLPEIALLRERAKRCRERVRALVESSPGSG